MNSKTTLGQLALGIGLVLGTAAATVSAAAPTDTTEIEVVNAGQHEKLSIKNLQVGETRQLYSEAGTLVTATRTADTLELDIAGDHTSIRMRDPHALADSDSDAATMIDLLGDTDSADGKTRRVVRIQSSKDVTDGDASTSEGGEPHVVILKLADGEAHEFDEEDMHLVIDQDAPGKQVIVKRHLVHEGDD